MTKKITVHSKGESRSIGNLIPYARNARTHSETQIAQLLGSFREFGFTNPVLIDEDNNIIAGHARVLAAEKAGMADVPVIVVGGLSDTKRRALILADNQLALNAGWDDELLGLELRELANDPTLDLELLGFDQDTLDLALNGLADTDSPDEFPEFDEGIDTEHKCPKCGYTWSGKSR